MVVIPCNDHQLFSITPLIISFHGAVQLHSVCTCVPSASQHIACRCPCGWGPELNPGIAPGTDLSSHLSGLWEERRTNIRKYIFNYEMLLMMVVFCFYISVFFFFFLQCTLVNIFGHLDSIEGREDAGSSSPHVVTLTPQVLRLVQY